MVNYRAWQRGYVSPPYFRKTGEKCATEPRCGKKVSARQQRRRVKADKKNGKSRSQTAKWHKRVYRFRTALSEREVQILNAIGRAKGRKFTPYNATEWKSKLPPLPRSGEWTRFVAHNKRVYVGKEVCHRAGHSDIAITTNIELSIMELHPNERKKDQRLKNPFMAVPRLQLIDTTKTPKTKKPKKGA